MLLDSIPDRSCLNCNHAMVDMFRGHRHVSCVLGFDNPIDREKHYDYLDQFDDTEEIIHLAALDCNYFQPIP